MKYSAGIIPFRLNNGQFEFFVGHPGGIMWKNKNYWSFLKGHVENGENWQETAIREFKEESGITLKGITIKDMIPLGSSLQNPSKTVIAFGIYYPDIVAEKCHSNMADNGLNPEIDKYKWMTFDELIKVTHKNHIKLYKKLISLYKHEYYEHNKR